MAELLDVALRCATAGSVDDGKSTLIGRLLFDANALFEDQLSHVAEASKKRGRATDLSLLTDGLRAEREQGITIDVAWRYAKTARRRLVLADAPGHVQYTRNTITAASTADVLVILVDATRVGSDAAATLLPQTKRHLAASLFLGVRQVAIAVNKMDAVDFSQLRFARIQELVNAYVASHAIGRRRPFAVQLRFFPVSALDGDNVVHPSQRMPWFAGPPLLAHLESIPRLIPTEHAARFSVQWVRRVERNVERAYSGRLLSGQLAVGDAVKVVGGQESRVKAVRTLEGDAAGLVAGQSATVTLTDDIDISRGDVLVHADDGATPVREVTLDVAWLGHDALSPGQELLLKHGAKKVRAVVSEIEALYDVESGQEGGAARLALNDLGRIRVRTSAPLLWDRYDALRDTGRAILIGKENADTVGAAIFSS